MIRSKNGIGVLGLEGVKQTWNPAPARTIEIAICRGEGRLAASGAFLAVTAPFTGRSPQDKFIVREPLSEAKVWWGKVNQPLEPHKFDVLVQDVKAYLNTRELFIRDIYAGADPAYRLNVRLISESAWHTLFAYNQFIRPYPAELADFTPSLTILHAPEFHPDPQRHGTRAPTSGPSAVIALHLTQRLVVIAGTRYAGEIKKSVFTAMNYLLPFARRVSDALRGERRAGWRHGIVLWPERHRQDHPLRRPPSCTAGRR